ncbi:MAG: V-type ATP synthase subunit D [Desulfuromonadales bacterium]|nr:V-type ATP synthase subunit D [Desulfuromonadales bacterium]NIS42494.1 V-type ATP synthase subunit D [Desulfuromonadales bacterium]
MIHPTRTNLLLLRERRSSVVGSVAILKGRRQALIREFLATSKPLLETREAIRERYAAALQRLQVSLGSEGVDYIASLAPVNRQEPGLKITPGNVLGLKFSEVTLNQSVVRTPIERGYDFRTPTPHLDEALHLFETIAAEMLDTAIYEAKLKRLEEELRKISRRIRVLEEKVMPRIESDLHGILQYLGEREREAYFRLKRFKQRTAGN